MSTLWTPGGERPIRRSGDDGPGGSAGGGSGQGPAGGGSGGGGSGGGGSGRGSEGGGIDGADGPTEEQLDALRDQLLHTPAAVIVANHAYSLFELGALHLSMTPPQLEQASVAIDAFAGIVEALGDRLGEAAPQLNEALAQMRLAFVQIHAAATQGAGAAPAPEAGDG